MTLWSDIIITVALVSTWAFVIWDIILDRRKIKREFQEKGKKACLILLEEFLENLVRVPKFSQENTTKIRLTEWNNLKNLGLIEYLGNYDELQEFFKYYQLARRFNDCVDELIEVYEKRLAERFKQAKTVKKREYFETNEIYKKMSSLCEFLKGKLGMID